MAVWKITVDFGSGHVDITDHCSNLERELTAHKDLRPVINTAKFTVTDLATVNLLLAGDNDLPVVITKDGAAWFTGQVRPTYDAPMTSHMEATSIQCVDNSMDLKKTIDESFAWTDYKVCDTTTKASSIVHQLLVKAGFALGDMSLTDINVTISKYVVQRNESKTYWKELSDLLYEFGYVFDYGVDGVYILRHLHPVSLTTSRLTDVQTAHVRRTKRKRQRWEAVRLTWHPVVTFTGVLVFCDRTGGDDTNPMNVDLADTVYYPPGSDTDEVYSVYRYDDAEILDVTNEVLTWSKTGAVTLNTESYESKRANIKFVGGGGGGVLTRFEIRGDATVRDKTKVKREVVYNVVGTERIMERTARFIESLTNAQQFVSDVTNYYDYAKFTYPFEVADADLSVSLMDEFELVSDAQNATTDIRIIAIREDEWGHRFVTAEGISAYSPLSTETQDTINPPSVIAPIDDNDRNITKEEDQNGYDDTGSGGTTTPTVPTPVAYSAELGTALACDRQTNLTNFARYEWQVSDDAGVTAYALGYDGTGLGVEDADTDIAVEFHVHRPLPLDVTGGADAPVDKTWHYRVRRVTLAATASAWSSWTSADSQVVGSGSLAQDSVYANNIVTAALQALFADVTTLAVGYDGAGSYASPSEGDSTLLIDDARMFLQKYLDGGWSDVNKLSFGVLAGAVILNMVGCRGIVHPDADPADLAEPIPSESFHVLDFEDDYADQNDVTPDATSNPDRSAAWAKFGTRSFTATAGNTGYLRYDDYIDLAKPFGASAWMRWEDHTTTDAAFISFAYLVDATHKISATLYPDDAGTLLRATFLEYNGGAAVQNVVIEYPCDLLDGNDHHIGLILDSTNDTFSLVFDDEVTTEAIVALVVTGASTTNTITFTAYNATGYEYYFDDVLFSADDACDPDLFVQHYLSEIAWTYGVPYDDLVLKPPAGRNVIVALDGGEWKLGAGIVEQGSNANGEYIIFSNGWQICWDLSATLDTTSTGAGNIFRAGARTFTFPKAFSVAPSVTPKMVRASGVVWTGSNSATLSTTQVVLTLLGSANTDTGYLGYTAVGWTA